MKLMLEPDYKPLNNKIRAFEKVFMIGSCFSNNMKALLEPYRFDIMSNPYGIMFDAPAILRALQEISALKQYEDIDLFHYLGVYRSWSHHSQFSDVDKYHLLNTINEVIIQTSNFLKQTNTAIITLGSSFSYYLRENNRLVANCHKYPQNSFDKQLMGTDFIQNVILEIINILRIFNPNVRIILTISPVRHIRDGVIENNRSKSRLIEAVHSVIELDKQLYYFPAYEHVIDVLRDYRFYDIDMVHPNYLATNLVFELFEALCLDPNDYPIYKQMSELYKARNHKPQNPKSIEHQRFVASILSKIENYQTIYPNVDFSEEKKIFYSFV